MREGRDPGSVGVEADQPAAQGGAQGVEERGAVVTHAELDHVARRLEHRRVQHRLVSRVPVETVAKADRTAREDRAWGPAIRKCRGTFGKIVEEGGLRLGEHAASVCMILSAKRDDLNQKGMPSRKWCTV